MMRKPWLGCYHLSAEPDKDSNIWGHSSNGRAGALQALGCGFESHWLHGMCPASIAYRVF